MPLAHVHKAVLPVAGLGTRFLPATRNVPKEMLPLVDRPCLDYVAAEAVAAGIEELVLVTAEGKEAVEAWFRPAPHLEAALERLGRSDLLDEVRRVAAQVRVRTVLQTEARGLGHAVLTARPLVGDEPFAVLLADDVIVSEQPAIGQLLDAWRDSGGAMVALQRVPPEETSRYGICSGTIEQNRMRVTGLVEKPEPARAPSNVAVVGRYVLPPEVFDLLERTPPGRGGEIQLTDALAVLAGRGAVQGLLFEGERFDTGTPLGLLEATLHLALRRPDLAPGLRRILAELPPV
ncbi:MAG: UTP--glucose-1-phosphate uridylyltransferase [Deltaproteobacteria bacterium]|nr:UTP--glucose-1-phosphate uridylyltransferase [Deltaproteobacteria bacterium]